MFTQVDDDDDESMHGTQADDEEMNWKISQTQVDQDDLNIDEQPPSNSPLPVSNIVVENISPKVLGEELIIVSSKSEFVSSSLDEPTDDQNELSSVKPSVKQDNDCPVGNNEESNCVKPYEQNISNLEECKPDIHHHALDTSLTDNMSLVGCNMVGGAVDQPQNVDSFDTVMENSAKYSFDEKVPRVNDIHVQLLTHVTTVNTIMENATEMPFHENLHSVEENGEKQENEDGDEEDEDSEDEDEDEDYPEIDLNVTHTQGFLLGSPLRTEQRSTTTTQLSPVVVTEIPLIVDETSNIESDKEIDIFEDEGESDEIDIVMIEESLLPSNSCSSDPLPLIPVMTAVTESDTMLNNDHIAGESAGWIDAKHHSTSALGKIVTMAPVVAGTTNIDVTKEGEGEQLVYEIEEVVVAEEKQVAEEVIAEDVVQVVEAAIILVEEEKSENLLSSPSKDNSSISIDPSLVNGKETVINNGNDKVSPNINKMDTPTIASNNRVLIVDVGSLESKIKEGADLSAVKAEVEQKLAELMRLQALLAGVEPSQSVRPSIPEVAPATVARRYSTFAAPSIATAIALDSVANNVADTSSSTLSTPRNSHSKFRRKLISSSVTKSLPSLVGKSIDLFKDEDQGWAGDDADAIELHTTASTRPALPPRTPSLLTSALAPSESVSKLNVKVHEESAGSRTKLAEALFSGQLSANKKPPLPPNKSSSIQQSRKTDDAVVMDNNDGMDLQDTQDNSTTTWNQQKPTFQRLRKNDTPSDSTVESSVTSNSKTVPAAVSLSTDTNNNILPHEFVYGKLPHIWSDVWAMLESVGWHWTKGKGLIDFFYLKPFVSRPQKPFLFGKDYFGSPDDVLAFIHQEIKRLAPSSALSAMVDDHDGDKVNHPPLKKKKIIAENEEDIVKFIAVPPKKFNNDNLPEVPTKKKFKQSTNEEEEEGKEAKIGQKRSRNEQEDYYGSTKVYAHPQDSSAEVEWNPMHTATEEKDSRLDIRRAPWSAIWKLLRGLGWQWDFGPGHVNYYYRPGFSYRRDKEATLGFDKFESEDAVRRFIKREMRDVSSPSSTSQEWSKLFVLPERTTSMTAAIVAASSKMMLSANQDPLHVPDSQILADAHLTDPNWTLTTHRPKRETAISATVAIATASSMVSSSTSSVTSQLPSHPPMRQKANQASANKRLTAALTDSLLASKQQQPQVSSSHNAKVSESSVKRSKLEATVPSTVSSSLIDPSADDSNDVFIECVIETSGNKDRHFSGSHEDETANREFTRNDSMTQDIATQPQETYLMPSQQTANSFHEKSNNQLRRKTSIPSLLALSPTKQEQESASPISSSRSQSIISNKHFHNNSSRNNKITNNKLREQDTEEPWQHLSATSSASRAAAAPYILKPQRSPETSSYGIDNDEIALKSSPRKQPRDISYSSSAAVSAVASESSPIKSGKKRSLQQATESLVHTNVSVLSAQKQTTMNHGIVTSLLEGYEILLSGFVDEVRDVLTAMIERNGGKILSKVPAEMFQPLPPSTVSSDQSDLDHDPYHHNNHIRRRTRHIYDNKPSSRHIILLSKPSEFRKPKFIQALIAGVPLIHYQWLLDSLQASSLFALSSYFLPAGYSALHAHYVMSPKYMPWLRHPPINGKVTVESIARHNKTVSLMTNCQHRRCNIFHHDDVNEENETVGVNQGGGVRSGGRGGVPGVSYADGAAKVMNLTGLKAWDEILMSLGMQVIPADRVTCERLRMQQETSFLAQQTSPSSATMHPSHRTATGVAVEVDYLLFDPVTYVRSALYYEQLSPQQLSSHRQQHTSNSNNNTTNKDEGIVVVTKEQIVLLQLCARLQQHQKNKILSNNSSSSSSLGMAMAVSIDWLAHCIFLNRRLSPDRLDLFQMPKDFHKEILVFKNELLSSSSSSTVNVSQSNNEKSLQQTPSVAISKLAERYCKYDLVYYDAATTAAVSTTPKKNPRSQWCIGRILSIHRRPNTTPRHGEGDVLLRTALQQRQKQHHSNNSSSNTDGSEYVLRIMRMDVFDTLTHDQTHPHVQDISAYNERFRVIEPVIPRQEVFISPQQLRGKVVLLTRHLACSSSRSPSSSSTTVYYASLPAQENRRQVWRRILTQHATQPFSLKKPSSSTTSKTHSATVGGNHINVLKKLLSTEEEEWLEDILVTTPLYEDELPIVPWMDIQEPYPEQFENDGDNDDNYDNDSDHERYDPFPKRSRYASQDM